MGVFEVLDVGDEGSIFGFDRNNLVWSGWIVVNVYYWLLKKGDVGFDVGNLIIFVKVFC